MWSIFIVDPKQKYSFRWICLKYTQQAQTKCAKEVDPINYFWYHLLAVGVKKQNHSTSTSTSLLTYCLSTISGMSSKCQHNTSPSYEAKWVYWLQMLYQIYMTRVQELSGIGRGFDSAKEVHFIIVLLLV